MHHDKTFISSALALRRLRDTEDTGNQELSAVRRFPRSAGALGPWTGAARPAVNSGSENPQEDEEREKQWLMYKRKEPLLPLATQP
jgi:hypothetical protein